VELELIKKNKVFITLFSALLVFGHLLVEHFHGGVVTHFILQDDSLPGISNWWGLLTFPLATWVVLLRIEKRNNASQKERNKNVLYRLVSAIIFGIVVSYLFSIESTGLDYLMLSLFALSLFIPLYFGEYLLGFTIGTMFVFGANIPIIGGIVLISLLFLLYNIPRFVFRFVRYKLN
jgi:hypothetical protein